MKFNYKIYRGDKQHRHCDARWLWENQTELVDEVNIEAPNGNLADKIFNSEFEIKKNWYVKRTTIER